MKNRKLMYWCGDRYLGALIESLPANEKLYPIVVPFNAGVCVSISSLNCDPYEM